MQNSVLEMSGKYLLLATLNRELIVLCFIVEAKAAKVFGIRIVVAFELDELDVYPVVPSD